MFNPLMPAGSKWTFILNQTCSCNLQVCLSMYGHFYLLGIKRFRHLLGSTIWLTRFSRLNKQRAILMQAGHLLFYKHSIKWFPVPKDFCQLAWPEAYSETTQTSKMKLFAKIVNCQKPLAVFIFSFEIATGVVLRNQLATLFKKRLWHRCFLVIFAKFLRTSFLQNTSGGSFCEFWMRYWRGSIETKMNVFRDTTKDK